MNTNWGDVTPSSSFTMPPDEVIFGKTPAMVEIKEKLSRAADAIVPVLIQGESGTGKEIIARLIHVRSPWRANPFVKVHCPAIPGTLLESELFGYEQGAFTGANVSKPGRVEAAQGGTLFIDEISEMAPGLQAKLLHVLQDGQMCRLGGQEQKQIDTRIICAANRWLEDEIAAERFRADLYYRISVFNICLPPLRERKADIPLLVNYFLTACNTKYNRATGPPTSQCMQIMMAHNWPGNIRELENLITRYVIFGSEQVLVHELTHSRSGAGSNTEAERGASLRSVARRAALEAQRQVILRVLQANNWNRKEAARVLKISYRGLLYKIKDTGIPRKRAVALLAEPVFKHVN
jgi:two-component system, NtrC family, response regulator AtoC